MTNRTVNMFSQKPGFLMRLRPSSWKGIDQQELEN